MKGRRRQLIVLLVLLGVIRGPRAFADHAERAPTTLSNTFLFAEVEISRSTIKLVERLKKAGLSPQRIAILGIEGVRRAGLVRALRAMGVRVRPVGAAADERGRAGTARLIAQIALKEPRARFVLLDDGERLHDVIVRELRRSIPPAQLDKLQTRIRLVSTGMFGETAKGSYTLPFSELILAEQPLAGHLDRELERLQLAQLEKTLSRLERTGTLPPPPADAPYNAVVAGTGAISGRIARWLAARGFDVAHADWSILGKDPLPRRRTTRHYHSLERALHKEQPKLVVYSDMDPLRPEAAALLPDGAVLLNAGVARIFDHIAAQTVPVAAHRTFKGFAQALSRAEPVQWGLAKGQRDLEVTTYDQRRRFTLVDSGRPAMAVGRDKLSPPIRELDLGLTEAAIRRAATVRGTEGESYQITRQDEQRLRERLRVQLRRARQLERGTP